MAKILNINDDIKLNLSNVQNGNEIQSNINSIDSYAQYNRSIIDKYNIPNWGWQPSGTTISSLLYPGFYRVYDPSDKPSGMNGTDYTVLVTGYRNPDNSLILTQICFSDCSNNLAVRFVSGNSSSPYYGTWSLYQSAQYSLSGNDLHINF